MENISLKYQSLQAEEKAQIQDLVQDLNTYFGQEGYEATQRLLENGLAEHSDLELCNKFVVEIYFHYFRGMIGLFNSVYVEAREAMFAVYSNASQIPDLQSLGIEADVLCSYLTGLIEVQEGNIKKGLDNLQQAQKNLQNQNNYAKYQRTLEAFTPDILFISAVKSLQSMNYNEAKSYANQAAEKALLIVKNYGANDAYTSNFFEGLSHYYRAYIDFYIAERDIASYYFNTIILKNNVASLAFDKAIHSFEEATIAYATAIGENLLLICKVMFAFSFVQTELANAMTAKLQGKSSECNFDLLRTKLYDAQAFIDKIIIQQLQFIHLKELLDNRINQMEKWSFV